jgi:hypothetical protein
MVQKIYKFQVFIDGTEHKYLSRKTCINLYIVYTSFTSLYELRIYYIRNSYKLVKLVYRGWRQN